jgi:hypothetical protein
LRNLGLGPAGGGCGCFGSPRAKTNADIGATIFLFSAITESDGEEACAGEGSTSSALGRGSRGYGAGAGSPELADAAGKELTRSATDQVFNFEISG